jgi:diguanylate cyclase (GGDEF)-like protein
MPKRIQSTGVNDAQFNELLLKERLESARRFLPRSTALSALGLMLFALFDFATDTEGFWRALGWRVGGCAVLLIMAMLTRLRIPRVGFEFLLLIPPAVLIWVVVLAASELRDGPQYYIGGIAMMFAWTAAWCPRKRSFFSFNTVMWLSVAWYMRDLPAVTYQALLVITLLGVMCAALYFDFLYRLSARNLRLRLELKAESRTDQLTGLPNRRALLERAEDLLARTQRKKSEGVGFLLIDADHFKRVNDQHGHDVGDAVLQALASAIANAVGDPMQCGRLGGEEFAVIIGCESQSRLAQLAEQILQGVRDFGWQAESLPTMTVSIGACFATSGEVSNCLRLADLRLYAAKRQGRDRAVFQDESDTA